MIKLLHMELISKQLFEANGTSGIVCPKHLQVHTITGQ
jgi:hypothetical protein